MAEQLHRPSLLGIAGEGIREDGKFQKKFDQAELALFIEEVAKDFLPGFKWGKLSHLDLAIADEKINVKASAEGRGKLGARYSAEITAVIENTFDGRGLKLSTLVVEEKKSSKEKPNSASIELAGMKHDVQELLQYPHTALEDRLKYKFKRQQIDISDIALHIDEDGLSIDLRGKPTKTRHVNVLPDRAPKKRLFGKNDSAPAKKTPAREPVSPPAVEAPPAPPATSEPLKSSLEDPVDEELIEKPFAPAAKKIKKERIKKFFAKLRDGWREGLALRKEYNEGIREERQERRAAVKKKIAERKKTRKEARDARILARKNKQERKRKRTREIIRKIYTSRITRAIEFVGGPVLSYLLFPDVVSQYVGLAAFIHSGVQTLILYLNKHAKHGSHH